MACAANNRFEILLFDLLIDLHPFMMIINQEDAVDEAGLQSGTSFQVMLAGAKRHWHLYHHARMVLDDSSGHASAQFVSCLAD